MTGGDGSLLLGQERDLRGEVLRASAPAGHDPQHLEGGDDPVARRRVLQDDHVAALLAAQRSPADLHPLEDVLVADRGPDDLPAGRLHDRLEPAVREHRYDEAAVGQDAPLEPVQGEDAEDLVAVDDRPGRVDGDEPVRVAIEGEADVGAPRADFGGQRCRGGGAGADVDVHPVRVVVDDLDPGARRREDLRADHAARAVGAVDHDPDVGRDRPSERQPRAR